MKAAAVGRAAAATEEAPRRAASSSASASRVVVGVVVGSSNRRDGCCCCRRRSEAAEAAGAPDDRECMCGLFLGLFLGWVWAFEFDRIEDVRRFVRAEFLNPILQYNHRHDGKHERRPLWQ